MQMRNKLIPAKYVKKDKDGIVNLEYVNVTLQNSNSIYLTIEEII